MKRYLLPAFLILSVIFINLYAAMSNAGTDETVVQSSGTTIVTFDKYTNEIEYIRESTTTVYMDFYAVDCSSNSYTDYLISDASATGKDAIKGKVEARTKRMSVWTDDRNVVLRIRGRHWE